MSTRVANCLKRLKHAWGTPQDIYIENHLLLCLTVRKLEEPTSTIGRVPGDWNEITLSNISIVRMRVGLTFDFLAHLVLVRGSDQVKLMLKVIKITMNFNFQFELCLAICIDILLFRNNKILFDLFLFCGQLSSMN